MRLIITAILLQFVLGFTDTNGCSVVYYVDRKTGNIYVANNEDYWYDVKAYIRIIPKSNAEHARLWYGWKDFAQGGVNEKGLFFDGAVTPDQEISEGYGKPDGNLGDDILANCTTVEEAIDYLEKERIMLTNAHMMFGDRKGNAVVVEWVNGQRRLNWITNNKLIMTNFLLSDTTQGNYPCYRYNSIEDNIDILERGDKEVSLAEVGNVLGNAAQLPRSDENGKVGGTLYSTFIDISNMKFVLVYKLDNSKVTKLDLKEEFLRSKRRRIKLK